MAAFHLGEPVPGLRYRACSPTDILFTPVLCLLWQVKMWKGSIGLQRVCNLPLMVTVMETTPCLLMVLGVKAQRICGAVGCSWVPYKTGVVQHLEVMLQSSNSKPHHINISECVGIFRFTIAWYRVGRYGSVLSCPGLTVQTRSGARWKDKWPLAGVLSCPVWQPEDSHYIWRTMVSYWRLGEYSLPWCSVKIMQHGWNITGVYTVLSVFYTCCCLISVNSYMFKWAQFFTLK